MSLFVAVLDPSGAPEGVRTWSSEDGVATVVGTAAAPALARHVAGSGAERVVLVARRRDWARAGFVANVVSGALPHLPVTRVQTRASLLAATSIALRASRLEDVPDSTRLSVLEQTDAGLLSGFWVRRVTRLASPSPSFGQHLRSLLPGGPGFVALCGADDLVVKAKPGGFASVARPGTLVVAGASAQAVDHLARWHGGDHRVVDPLVSSVQRLYGNDGAEFAVLPPELAAAAPVTGTCPVCALPAHGASCRFCHVRPRSVQELSA
ncbi:hypothetical protein ACOCJ5_08005 [Knoellia sp. CPCC 206450]|uniref:hypothetical protein n=1 Tax=Knoellia tibetensis TaxID=3404798 RepID=UPI003B4281DF